MDGTSTNTRIGAFDGLRGLAVAAVLAFHCGFAWAEGGFLGVSLFFTLSGYLITSLLLAERASTGHIALGAFWARRARRLLPAAVLALAGIVVFGATTASASQLRTLRGDVVGALAYVANWRFVFRGAAYADLWSSPSPVQHFWSLAIEEQLYLFVPLVVAVTLARGRGRRSLLVAVLCAGVGVSLLASIASSHDQLRAYYGTDARAAELLVGALLAVVLAGREVPGRWPTRVAGPVALGLLLAAWYSTSTADPRLFQGGLVAHAALAAVVILSARSGGPFATALSWRPLRGLGRISYGVYLYHWPIFLWLTASRVHVSGLGLAALRVAVTLAVAVVSFHFIEQPIHLGRRLAPRLAPVAFAGAAFALAVGAVMVTSSVPPPATGVDLAAAPGLVAPSRSTLPPAPAALAAPSTTSATSAARVTVGLGRPLRVYVAGDSNAYILGLQLKTWGESHQVDVWVSGWFGCQLVPGGTYRWAGEPKHTTSKCNGWKTDRAKEVATIQPDIVLVISGAFDLLDRRWDGSDEWTHIGTPDFDQLLEQNLLEMNDIAGATGAQVVWATYPRIRTGIVDGEPPDVDWPESDATRVERLNALIRDAAAQRPFARIIDLRAQLQAWPNGELDPAKREDGLHPNAPEVVELTTWIGEQLTSLPVH